LNKGKRYGATALAITAAALGAAPAANAASPRHRIAASRPSGAADRGAVAPSAGQSLRVYLAPRGGADALKAAAEAVSDPDSPSFGQYLTPAQFRARFAPADATVRSVSRWLRASGLKVTGVERASRYVEATGDAAAAEKAFAVRLHRFAKGGDTFQAPDGAVTVPKTVAGAVLAVQGLSTQAHAMKPRATYPAGFVNGKPCSQYYGQVAAKYQADFKTPLPKFNGKTIPYAPCGYQPAQFRSAYEGAAPYTGAGQTVAITDAYAAPTILQDANQYATRHGDPAFAAGQFTQRNAGGQRRQAQCDPTGWYGEETLDVEAVHAMATGAKVLYYGARSCFDDDFLTTLTKVVDDNDASIVTNSWGDLESNETAENVAAYDQLFQQAALQGIAVLFSSGDNGDEVQNSGIRQADYPASDPFITAVGGTSTGIGQDGKRLFDTGWGTDKFSLSGSTWAPNGYLYGAGGGYSGLFNRPSYQNGVVPATGSDAGSRAVPDVAMDADPTTGMLVGETQEFPSGVAYGEYRIGGTSLASPLMAGFQAATQERFGGREGFLNPGIYRAAKYSNDFDDVSKPGPDAGNVRADYANGVDASGGILYSVRTFDQDSGLDGDGSVKPGWDEITGVGVPNAKYLKSFRNGR
jgi:subtilase family serine protease